MYHDGLTPEPSYNASADVARARRQTTANLLLPRDRGRYFSQAASTMFDWLKRTSR